MQEWTVAGPDAGMRLDKWLASRGGAGSRRRAAEWLAKGKVFLDDEPVDDAAAGHAVTGGQRIGVWIDRPGSARRPDRSLREARDCLRILHEDDSFVVVDKPPGLIVEPLPRRAGEEATLTDLLAEHYRHSPRGSAYVVHRIDRDTSGLVLFARTPGARDALKAQFARRTPVRIYRAVLLGRVFPERGTWHDTLAWDPTSLRQRKAHGRDARGKAAEAHYHVITQFADAALVEVSLVTGKRNQIRVQAAMRGHPVLGERQYRFSAPPEPPGLPQIGRQALHAHRLAFIHPDTGRDVSFTSPLPSDLEKLIAELTSSGASGTSRTSPPRRRR
jgi:23S rRNA pseudouridine1911/1915/1917 synthase